jgi:outer membrane protein assembly factor BamB
VQLPGRGHSSPVFWKGKIFLTSEGAGGKRWIVCLDARDGHTIWKREDTFSPHKQHRYNSFASSTPCVDGSHVYVLWSSGESLLAMALDHEGKPVWKSKLGGFSAQHGSGASPVVVDGVLIASNDNEGKPSWLMGLDRDTGKTLWKRDRQTIRASYATPVVHHLGPDASEVLFASTAHGITSLDPRTGKLNWESGPIFKERCVGSAVIAEGVLLATAGAGGGGKESVALVLPGKKQEGKPRTLYSVRRAIPYVPTPVGYGKRFFLLSDGGIASCIKATTGEVVWRERLEGSFFGSPICVNDKLYVISRSGDLFVLAAKDEFMLLGRVSLGEKSSATPAVSVLAVMIALSTAPDLAAQAPWSVAQIRESYVSELIKLGDHCCRRSLFNDAERLVREAGEFGCDRERVDDRLDAIRKLRIGVMKGAPEQPYKDFLRSDDYVRFRREIQKSRKKLDERTITRLRAAARSGVKQSQTPAAEQAFELIHGIDPNWRFVGGSAERQLWRAVVRRGREKASISQMKLGEAISNHDLSLEDLKGKVVLWRSFSL